MRDTAQLFGVKGSSWTSVPASSSSVFVDACLLADPYLRLCCHVVIVIHVAWLFLVDESCSSPAMHVAGLKLLKVWGCGPRLVSVICFRDTLDPNKESDYIHLWV